MFLSLLLMAVLCVGALGWYLFQPPSRKHEINRYVGNYSQQHKRITVSQFLWDLWTLYIKRPFAQTRVQGGENIVLGGNRNVWECREGNSRHTCKNDVLHARTDCPFVPCGQLAALG